MDNFGDNSVDNFSARRSATHPPVAPKPAPRVAAKHPPHAHISNRRPPIKDLRPSHAPRYAAPTMQPITALFDPPTPLVDDPPPPPPGVVPAIDAAIAAGRVATPLDALRAALQPIARDLLCDVAYWENIKRNAAPRTFLDFCRFAYAADLEDKNVNGGGNAQVIIQAPFPRGPLDILPAHMRIE